MSSTNTAEENQQKTVAPEDQTQDSNKETCPTSSINTQFRLKLNVAPDASTEPQPNSSPLSSLDELARKLEKEHNEEQLRSAVRNETNSLDVSPQKCQKLIHSRSLDKLYDLSKKYDAGEGPSTGMRAYMSVNMLSVSESIKTNSLSSIFLLRKKSGLEDEESFITMDPCQKEKLIGTDVPTLFSANERTQNIIVMRGNERYQPPPPYEYHQGPQYQGNIGATPVYSTGYQGYGQGGPPNASQAPAYTVNYPGSEEDLFNTKEIRNQFVRKVYAILALQLLFTFGFIAFCIFEPNARKFVRTQMILLIMSMIVFFIMMIALACYQTIRRTFPLNFILLCILTASMAYMTAAISCGYDTYTVMVTMGVTAFICTLVSLIACQHWFDVTNCGFALCLATIIVLIYGLIATIITIITGLTVVYLIYSCLITLLITMYLIYDTQRIMGGRRIELSPEEYILGALTLYVDILIMFQHLLNIVAHCR